MRVWVCVRKGLCWGPQGSAEVAVDMAGTGHGSRGACKGVLRGRRWWQERALSVSQGWRPEARGISRRCCIALTLLLALAPLLLLQGTSRVKGDGTGFRIIEQPNESQTSFMHFAT